MLPLLRLAEGLGREAQYTRRPGWSQPLESLWAIMGKWQFVNRLPYATVARCVSSLSRTGLYQGVDLRVLEAFDLDALAHFSGVQASALCAGACVVSHSSPTLALASTNLRWCPPCMNEGFHAGLFQFLPITRCPTHNARLIQACPHCGSGIPYRLDPAATAAPLACPTCTASLVADLTVLARSHLTTGTTKNLVDWQHLLARYARWYCNVPHVHRRVSDEGAPPRATAASRSIPPRDRLAFIGTLQEALRMAPVLSSHAQLRDARIWTIKPPDAHLRDRTWKAPFSAQHWPHFQATGFVDLCRQFGRMAQLHRERDAPSEKSTTAWWYRTWQGSAARPCAAEALLEDPPFGVAEWVAFSKQPACPTSRRAARLALSLRFEQDLQVSWLAWSELLQQVPESSTKGLHPMLVPPRGCWLDDPTFSATSTALGS